MYRQGTYLSYKDFMKKVLKVFLSALMVLTVAVSTALPVKAETHIDEVYIKVKAPVVGEHPNYDNTITSKPSHDAMRSATLIEWYESDDNSFSHATKMEDTDKFKERKFYQIRFGSVVRQDPDAVIDDNTKFYVNNELYDTNGMRFYTGLELVRVYGNNRFSTSFAISNSLVADAKRSLSEGLIQVFLTSAENYADALAVSYAACRHDALAPIVVVNEKNRNTVAQYLRDHYVEEYTNVYIIGGKNAVPEKIEKDLSKDFKEVKRIAGNNRYETNLAIIDEFGLKGNNTLLVATGTNFADSLSASATGLPMLLVKGDDISDNQLAFMFENSFDKIYILGGEKAVSKGIEKTLSDFAPVTRISGNNRYETSKKIAEEFFKECKVVSVAYGGNFPDGLCGGPLAFYHGGPVLLVNEDNYSYVRAFVKAHPEIIRGIALGGTGVLSDSLFRKVLRERTHAPIRELQYEHLDGGNYDWYDWMILNNDWWGL